MVTQEIGCTGLSFMRGLGQVFPNYYSMVILGECKTGQVIDGRILNVIFRVIRYKEGERGNNARGSFSNQLLYSINGDQRFNAIQLCNFNNPFNGRWRSINSTRLIPKYSSPSHLRQTNQRKAVATG